MNNALLQSVQLAPQNGSQAEAIELLTRWWTSSRQDQVEMIQ